MAWFNEHKEGLQGEFPEANPNELTKLGMRQYKTIKANSVSNGHHKRKMNEDEERTTSGIAKLAKFDSRQNWNCGSFRPMRDY